MYWLIWNEPDLGNIANSDDISPGLAAQYFKTISDTIMGADPTARIIVGNVGSEYPPDPIGGCFPHPDGCGVNWLTQFISAYTTTNGIDPRPVIAGYGIHAYSDADKRGLGLASCGIQLSITADACLLLHFTATVQAGIDWINTNDQGKELWATEANWQSGSQFKDTWVTQTMRMQQICTYLATQPVQRYSWFYGGYPYSPSATNLITVSLFSAAISGTNVIYSGTLSPAGQVFTSSCQ